jgi:hypothetical protein
LEVAFGIGTTFADFLSYGIDEVAKLWLKMAQILGATALEASFRAFALISSVPVAFLVSS